MRQKDLDLVATTALNLINEEADKQPPSYFEAIEHLLGQIMYDAAYKSGNDLDTIKVEITIEIAQEAARGAPRKD